MKKNKKKKGTKKDVIKYFFSDNPLSILLFVLYVILCVFMYHRMDISGLISVLAVFSFIFSLILPEYVDKKVNTWVSRVLVWLFRLMLVAGTIYVYYDINRPCSWFCMNGLEGIVALGGLIIIPIVVSAIYYIIHLITKK